ncbi:MAG: beta-galactosidase [Pseudomonadota bacterium]
MKRSLGVCYYPEHWPEAIWADDAARMVDAGISRVRVGEFAWTRLEPLPGELRFAWLDRALETLGNAGLEVILGTPTATPPRWMLDSHPDMLAVDAEGRRRKFGSRRHYCFSHAGYAAECDRIVGLLAERYGRHDAVKFWQTDNEYGCHDTTLSYSDAARQAFRLWLARRYEDVSTLNHAWGNVFWSMSYQSFDQIDLPNLTVTEPNPAHVLAFKRFSSDQVVAFNRRQVEILRAHSDAPILHNFMGRELAFDHFEMGRDLDIAAWDSYPIGFLSDRIEASDTHKDTFLHQGDPDFQAFHHDLYRCVGNGRMWVMEQQPGPVNWAPWNPAPLPGMVRLWTWEAFAHGAETVAYFRWRQAPFAQEQMHAGLLRPDSVAAPGLEEARQVAEELEHLWDVSPAQAPVALVFDYQSAWMYEAQPQGADFDYLTLVLAWYRAARALGLSLDIVPPSERDFDAYQLVLAPGLAELPKGLVEAWAASGAKVILGPRAGSKTTELAIPVPLPPGVPSLDITVTAVESLPHGSRFHLEGGEQVGRWFEHLDFLPAVEVLRATSDGQPAVVRQGDVTYVAAWLDTEARRRLIADICATANIHTNVLPDGLRLRDTATHRFALNYSAEPVQWDGKTIEPAGVAWRAR